METYRYTARAGEDGTLIIKIPGHVPNGDVEVVVVVQPIRDPVQAPKKVYDKPPRAGEPWTEEEEQQVLSLRSQGKSPREIALILGRKPGAIESRLVKIMLRNTGKSE
jgi:DNA-binding NarL/FixJ family response regulator